MKLLSIPSLILVAAAATLLSTASASAAPDHPSVRRVADPLGDVVRVVDGAEEVITPVPGRRTGDIVGFGLVHRSRVVVARTRMVDFPAGDPFDLAVLELRTPTGTAVIAVESRPGVDPTTFFSFGTSDRCAGLRHRVDRDRATVTVRVPRRCVGNPAWVRGWTGVAYPGARPEVFLVDTTPGADVTREQFTGRAWHPSR